MLKDLESDMKDYLDQDQILRQMKNVFKAENPTSGDSLSSTLNSLTTKSKKNRKGSQ